MKNRSLPRSLAASIAAAALALLAAQGCGGGGDGVAPVPRDPGFDAGEVVSLSGDYCRLPDGGWIRSDGGAPPAPNGTCEQSACGIGCFCNEVADAGTCQCTGAANLDGGPTCVTTTCGVISCGQGCTCSDPSTSTCDCDVATDAGNADAGDGGSADAGDGGSADAGDAGDGGGPDAGDAGGVDAGDSGVADAGADAGTDAGAVDGGPLCALGDAGACMDLSCDAGCSCFKPDGGAPQCSCPAAFPDAGDVCRAPNCGTVECGFGCACADLDASVCYCGDARNGPDGGIPLTVRSIRTGIGNGSISVSPPDVSVANRTEQTFFYDAGTMVLLTAVPFNGQTTFIGWDGGCKVNGNDAGCLLQMNGPHDVTGLFDR